MIITKNILDENVPKEMIPTRLDSAMNLYTNEGDVLILDCGDSSFAQQ